MTRLPSMFLAVLALLLSVAPAIAQRESPSFETMFVPLSSAVPGVLYRPSTAGDRSHTAVVVMHPFASYLTHLACSQLSSRGYTVLGDTAQTLFNFADGWLASRFVS